MTDPNYADYSGNILFRLVKDELDFDGVYGQFKTKDEFVNGYLYSSDNTYSLTIKNNKVTLQDNSSSSLTGTQYFLKDAQLYESGGIYNASYGPQQIEYESSSGKMISYIESDLTYLKLIVGILAEGDNSTDGYLNFGAKLVYSSVINTTP